MSDVLKQALKMVEPTQMEIDFVNRVAKKAFALVRETSQSFDGTVDIFFGGSYAKETWLKNDADIDIFVKVRTEVDEKGFEKIGRELGLQALRKYKPHLRYSEHPYVEAIVDKIRVNVVPCYDVEKGKWKSAADRSPYHTEFIKKVYDAGRRREASLLKKFMKTIGVYGAEIAINGFSGYVCEVLVLKYGSFIGVLQAAAEFNKNQVISLESYNENMIGLFDSTLIIIDPIDNKRNLGTAISTESVGRMILAARRFVTEPDIRFFKSVSSKKHIRFAENLILIKFRYQKRSPDIIWGQLKSSVKAITKQLSIHGFRVIRFATSTDENQSAVFVFLLDSTRLPLKIVRQGPELFDRDDSKKFLKKNLGESNVIWVGDNARLFVLLDNKFVDVVAFLNLLLSDNLNTSGISPGLIHDITRGFKIYTGNKLKDVMKGFAKEITGELVETDQFAFG